MRHTVKTLINRLRIATLGDVRDIKEELSQRITQIEKYHHLLLPEVVPFPAPLKRRVAALSAEFGVDQFSSVIHKNDQMFRFLLSLEDYSLEQAVEGYFRSASHMAKFLNHFVHQWEQQNRAVEAVLDFASGYGRLTRLMVESIEPSRIWISDIKQAAVDFQISHFGVHGFCSCEDPAEFRCDQRFDVIFVASLFSHLAPAVWEPWLNKLIGLLNPQGILIFSVLDEQLMQSDQPLKNGYYYHGTNEESVATSDQELNNARYGTMYVSELYVRSCLERASMSEYRRFPKALWEHQDVYIAGQTDVSGFAEPGE